MTVRLWLVRHGETEWSASWKHTGRTDVPLDATGRRQAEAVGREIKHLKLTFRRAYTSPLQRTTETARLAGFPDATPMDELREWDYGQYEGRKTADIRRDENDPDWLIWTADIRGGETTEDVGRRADRARAALLEEDGDILVFSHGHFLRMFAARWIGLAAATGQFLSLDTGTISVLGFEHEYRVIQHWNSPLDGWE